MEKCVEVSLNGTVAIYKVALLATVLSSGHQVNTKHAECTMIIRVKTRHQANITPFSQTEPVQSVARSFFR